MNPVNRFQSQLLPRRSYKPRRVIRIRPARLNLVFRPSRRFGVKPQLAVTPELAGQAPSG